MARFPFKQPTKIDIQLIDAAKRGDVGQVERLLEAGANVNAVDHNFRTPLRMASRIGNVDMIRMLLSLGADPNLIEDGKTALMEAAYKGHREAVDLLLEAGANLFAKLEIHNGVFMDVPQFALEGAHRELAIYLRSLIHERKLNR